MPRKRRKMDEMTSIPCTEFVRRMLSVFKQAGGYSSYDDLLFDLIEARVQVK